MAKTNITIPPITTTVYTRLLAPLIPYAAIGIGLFVLQNAWVTIIGYHLGMVMMLYFAGKKSSFIQILHSSNYKILIITAVLGVAGGLLLYLLWPLLGIPQDISLYLENIGLSKAVWPYFLVYFILVNPWIEESYWRNYLASNTKRIIINDLLFSGYHILVLAGKIDLIWLIIVFIVLSLGAWFWRQANRWNQGISASIVSHIAADASVMITIYYMTVRGVNNLYT